MIKDAYEKFAPPERGRFGDNERAAPRSRRIPIEGASDLVDVFAAIHCGTVRAICVSRSGDEKHAVWLPRSQIEIEHKPERVIGAMRSGREIELGTCVVTLPEWLARKTGLV